MAFVDRVYISGSPASDCGGAHSSCPSSSFPKQPNYTSGRGHEDITVTTHHPGGLFVFSEDNGLEAAADSRPPAGHSRSLPCTRRLLANDGALDADVDTMLYGRR